MRVSRFSYTMVYNQKTAYAHYIFKVVGQFQGPLNCIQHRGTFVYSVAADRLTDLTAFSVNTGSDEVHAGEAGTLASACL